MNGAPIDLIVGGILVIQSQLIIENEIHMSDQIMSDLRPAAGEKFCIFSSLEALKTMFLCYLCVQKRRKTPPAAADLERNIFCGSNPQYCYDDMGP